MAERGAEKRVAAIGAPRKLTVCVFCGARSGAGPEPVAAARERGTLLGEHGHLAAGTDVLLRTALSV